MVQVTSHFNLSASTLVSSTGLPSPCVLVRLGIDGTKRWRQSLELMAVSVCTGHKAEDWHPVGMMCREEKRGTLCQFLNHTPWELEIGGGLTVPVGGRELPCLVTISHDHMAAVAMGSADPPGSKKDWRRPCVYCEATPKVLACLPPTCR